MKWFRVIINSYAFNIQAHSSESSLAKAESIMAEYGQPAPPGSNFQVWKLGVEQDPGDDAAVLLTHFCLDMNSNYNLRVRGKRLLEKMAASIGRKNA